MKTKDRNPDKEVLMVVHPLMASYMAKQDTSTLNAMVVTTAVEPGDIIAIPKQEFRDYLYGEGKFENVWRKNEQHMQ